MPRARRGRHSVGQNIALDVLGRSLRRGLTPELVDESVDGDDLPATEEQESQKRTRLAGWNLENAPAPSGLERPRTAQGCGTPTTRSCRRPPVNRRQPIVNRAR